MLERAKWSYTAKPGMDISDLIGDLCLLAWDRRVKRCILELEDEEGTASNTIIEKVGDPMDEFDYDGMGG